MKSMRKLPDEKKSVMLNKRRPSHKIKPILSKRRTLITGEVLENKAGLGIVRKKKKSWRQPRGGKGVVYLSNIPHGFYEKQIEAYFKQFGKVSGVSVPRSKTGRSKGYAFVEFTHPEVAKIAAETMNNYLMFKRLIKAKYIPAAEQKPQLFISAEMARLNHNTAADKAKLRMESNRKDKNRILFINRDAKAACRLVRKKKMLKGKIEKLGLDYDFDVEEGDIESIIKMKKEHQENKKKRKQNALSNNESSEGSDEELQSSEENKFPEISTSISGKKEISRKNKMKQKIGKTSLNPLTNSPRVQEKQNETNTEFPKENTLLKSGQKQTEAPTATDKKLKKHNKSPTTPLKDKSARKITESEAVVMEVDDNDEEISFKTPPNVLKKSVNSQVSGSKMTPKNRKKSNLFTPRKSSQFSLKTSPDK